MVAGDVPALRCANAQPAKARHLRPQRGTSTGADRKLEASIFSSCATSCARAAPVAQCVPSLLCLPLTDPHQPNRRTRATRQRKRATLSRCRQQEPTHHMALQQEAHVVRAHVSKSGKLRLSLPMQPLHGKREVVLGRIWGSTLLAPSRGRSGSRRGADRIECRRQGRPENCSKIGAQGADPDRAQILAPRAQTRSPSKIGTAPAQVSRF